VLLVATILYGYLFPCLVLIYGEYAIDFYTPVALHYSPAGFQDSLATYVSISTGLLILFFLQRGVVIRSRPASVSHMPEHFRLVNIRSAAVMLFVLSLISLNVRYGGVGGIIQFMGFATRRDAYDVVDFGGSLFGRLDLFAVLCAAFGFLLYFSGQTIANKSLGLLIALTPTVFLLFLGTRMQLMVTLTIWFYLAFFFGKLGSSKRILLLLLIVAVLFPLFTLWGELRNQRELILDFDYLGFLRESFLNLIPAEVVSGYIASMTWDVKDYFNIVHFLTQFFP
jgi:hypothetical protein